MLARLLFIQTECKHCTYIIIHDKIAHRKHEPMQKISLRESALMCTQLRCFKPKLPSACSSLSSSDDSCNLITTANGGMVRIVRIVRMAVACVWSCCDSSSVWRSQLLPRPQCHSAPLPLGPLPAVHADEPGHMHDIVHRMTWHYSMRRKKQTRNKNKQNSALPSVVQSSWHWVVFAHAKPAQKHSQRFSICLFAASCLCCNSTESNTTKTKPLVRGGPRQEPSDAKIIEIHNSKYSKCTIVHQLHPSAHRLTFSTASQTLICRHQKIVCQFERVGTEVFMWFCLFHDRLSKIIQMLEVVFYIPSIFPLKLSSNLM